MFDVADQMEIAERNEGTLLDTLVVERIHLRVKDWGERVLNTRCYERSVLEGVCNETLQKLNESRYIENHLIGQIDRVDNLLVAKGMDLETVSIHAGDVILGRDCGGLVLACALHERCPTLIVKKLAYTQQLSAHSLKMTYVSGPPCRCNPQEFKLAVAW